MRTNKGKLMDALKAVAPSVAFSVEITEDEFNTWDGDGPDPADEGYTAYQSDVSASVINGGSIVSGHAYLGGSYYLTAQECIEQEISGYLPQMLEEAADELRDMLKLPVGHGLYAEIDAVLVFLKSEMQRRYNEQVKA